MSVSKEMINSYNEIKSNQRDLAIKMWTSVFMRIDSDLYEVRNIFEKFVEDLQ
jgi:hypothetical protein